jgi:hypothetical protein
LSERKGAGSPSLRSRKVALRHKAARSLAIYSAASLGARPARRRRWWGIDREKKSFPSPRRFAVFTAALRTAWSAKRSLTSFVGPFAASAFELPLEEFGQGQGHRGPGSPPDRALGFLLRSGCVEAADGLHRVGAGAETMTQKEGRASRPGPNAPSVSLSDAPYPGARR